jgi:hypothetical protein
MEMLRSDGKCWNPRWKCWMNARRQENYLPYDEIGSRYLSGETLKDILQDYPKSPGEEVVRRALLRRGIRKKWIGPIGKRNCQWKGGRKKQVRFYRRQSYEVAAICLGKPLGRGEVIHHIDENSENNVPENLMIFPSQVNHAQYHQKLLRLQRKGEIVDTIQLASENGARRLQRPSSLIGWIPEIAAPFPSGRPGTYIGLKRPRHSSQQLELQQ